MTYLSTVTTSTLCCLQGMKDYADQQRRLQQEIKGYLERNQQRVLQREEEERQQLEERAQVEMAARASVQSIITSAQEAIQAHPEVRCGDFLHLLVSFFFLGWGLC